MTIRINERLIPSIVAVDSTILVSALDPSKTLPADAQCKDLVRFITTHRKLLIATAALAERLISGDGSVLGLPHVEFVEFGFMAARSTAEAIGSRAWLRAQNAPKQVLKYDALIVGTYLAAGAELFVSNDRGQATLARRAKLRTLTTEELFERVAEPRQLFPDA